VVHNSGIEASVWNRNGNYLGSRDEAVLEDSCRLAAVAASVAAAAVVEAVDAVEYICFVLPVRPI
jgi:hypothetical protein